MRIFTLIVTTFLIINIYSKKKQPNIVIILADDLGYNDLGCYGSKEIKTPNIDKMAKNGVVFSDFHTNSSVSTPTRASLMTGKYQQRVNAGDIFTVFDKTEGLPSAELTMAEMLKANGYVTGLSGKWHLGYDQKFQPPKQGFDYFKGYLAGNVDYHSHIDYVGAKDWYHNMELKDEKGYSTDLITKYALEFIESNKEKPFFLYIAHEAPHGPFQGRHSKAIREEGKVIKEDYSDYNKTRALYKEMVEVMDEGIGKVMESLKNNGLDENTLVLFFSDNGGARFSKNDPLKGKKASVYEGGHRVPCIAYWKDKLSHRYCNETILTMDLLPTIAKITESEFESDIDGINVKPVIFNGEEVSERDLFWKFRDRIAMRRGDWKLVHFQNNKKTELYNLKNDLAESNDLSANNKELVKEMMAKVNKWLIYVNKK
jgi:arylsulfatase A-like enzyme